MRLAVIVNTVDELVPTMTTAMLIAAATRRGHEVWVIDVTQLALADRKIVARARSVPGPAPHPVDAAWLGQLAHSALQTTALATFDTLWIRTNPARDSEHAGAHRALLDFARILYERDNVLVVNAPDGLARAASKLYLTTLPAHLRPPCLATNDFAMAHAFAAHHREVVIKPIRGTRGAGVTRITADDSSLATTLASVCAGGLALIEPFLPEVAHGDVRIVLIDGLPLEIDGHLAGMRRLPASGDFRANLHAGGSAAPATLDPVTRRIIAAIAPQLRREGLWLVGLDLIGEIVVELNVYATGGLYPASRFAPHVDFGAAVVAALENKLSAVQR
jgi:glutathione synthase